MKRASKQRVHVFTDGGARGNPGPAAIGGLVRDPDDGHILATFHRRIGERTNNQAEYEAVIEGLRQAKEVGATHVECFLDSQLVAEQLSRRYKVKDQDLGQLFVKAWNLMLDFQDVRFTAIPRERNNDADRLVNRALDGLE